MARYSESKITLSAGQAAGTSKIITAENTSGGGNKQAMILGNPTANTLNLHLSTNQTHGTGMPVPPYSIIALGQAFPGFDGDMWLTGASTGDAITLWTA